ncbi:class I glutamine amidotransferase-like protein [Lentinus tigrinus ALCF2SS1-7]|uniref:class I glutamine amidotransferase-like protein n=1 Tax=Lentinus tigrinus ALCF2SS1-7 TaxID=1328758 RepID=UPI0011661524|nr:class I glutamine amidotransferase-like protein [Lentinus tigrinus ALCF2SS1-7]
MLALTRFALLVLVSLLAMTQTTNTTQLNTARILIYSATRDFRHDSIPTAVDALVQGGPSHQIAFDHTEDQTWFTDERLAQYDAVLFLSNTGEVLDDAGKAALQRYLDLGGNFVAVHSASDALRNTTWFIHEVGAAFDYHPEITNATVDIIGPSHPSTEGLPNPWPVQDEMYNFKSDPRSIGAVVVLSANESSYTDPGPRKFDQGTPHPTAWYQEHGAGVDSNGTAGRSFYTSLGHLNETWQNPTFLGHVFGGIQWTLQSNTTLAFNATAKVGNGTSESISSTSGSATGSSPSATTSSPSSATPSWLSPKIILYGALGAIVTLLAL